MALVLHIKKDNIKIMSKYNMIQISQFMKAKPKKIVPSLRCVTDASLLTETLYFLDRHFRIIICCLEANYILMNLCIKTDSQNFLFIMFPDHKFCLNLTHLLNLNTFVLNDLLYCTN